MEEKIKARLEAALADISLGNRGMTWAHNAASFKRANKQARGGFTQLEAIRQELAEQGMELVLVEDTLYIQPR
jgi:hypothetical protein